MNTKNRVFRSGDLVRFIRDDANAGAGISAGEIGIILQNAQLTGLYLVRVGNPDYLNDRLIHIDKVDQWLRLYKAQGGLTDAFAWWGLHWQEYQPETRVLFRMFKGYVLAFFPDLPGRTDSYDSCECFDHIGQHDTADLRGCIAASRPATPEEYAPLVRELESAPYFYRLKVCKRTPSDSHHRRLGALAYAADPV